MQDCIDSLSAFFQAALQLIAARVGSAVVPVTYGTRTVFGEDGSVAQHIIPQRAFWRVVVGIPSQSYIDLPEAHAVVRLLLDHRLVEPPGMSDSSGQEIQNPTFDQILPGIVAMYLLPLVIRYVEQVDGFAFDAKRVETIAKQAIEEWHAKEILSEVTVPLVGFTTDDAPIGVTSLLRIEPFSEEAKNSLWSDSIAMMPMMGIMAFASSRFRLAGSHRVLKGARTMGAMAPAARTVVTALRLLRTGNVGAPVLLESPVPVGGHGLAASAMSFNDLWVPWGVPEYQFGSTDQERLSDLIARLEDPALEPQRRALSVALRRFNQSYTREVVEDKLIDWAVALESTLLFDANDELAYKLATRGAALLAQNREPEDTHRILGSLYKCRSKIVHSGKTLGEIARDGYIAGETTQQLTSSIEQVVREVSRAYLDRIDPSRGIMDINDELDVRLIAGLKERR